MTDVLIFLRQRVESLTSKHAMYVERLGQWKQHVIDTEWVAAVRGSVYVMRMPSSAN